MNHLQPSRYKFAMAGVTQRYKTSSMVECIYNYYNYSKQLI